MNNDMKSIENLIFPLSKVEYERLQKAVSNSKKLHESHKGKYFGNKFVICPFCGHRQRRMEPIQEKPIHCVECGKRFTIKGGLKYE